MVTWACEALTNKQWLQWNLFMQMHALYRWITRCKAETHHHHTAPPKNIYTVRPETWADVNQCYSNNIKRRWVLPRGWSRLHCNIFICFLFWLILMNKRSTDSLHPVWNFCFMSKQTCQSGSELQEKKNLQNVTCFFFFHIFKVNIKSIIDYIICVWKFCWQKY